MDLRPVSYKIDKAIVCEVQHYETRSFQVNWILISTLDALFHQELYPSQNEHSSFNFRFCSLLREHCHPATEHKYKRVEYGHERLEYGNVWPPNPLKHLLVHPTLPSQTQRDRFLRFREA